MRGKNTVEAYDGFYVSFNPDPNPSLDDGILAPIIEMGAALAGFDEAVAETALVKDKRFYILNGDHREAYRRLGPKGWPDCIQYFMDHIDEKSDWSNIPEKD